MTGTLSGKIRRWGLAALLLGALSVSLAACGSDTGSSSSSSTTSAAAATTGTDSSSSSAQEQEVQVKLMEWGIEPKDIQVNAGKVKFVVSNDGKFKHDLAISQNGTEINKTPIFQKADGTKSFEVDLKPGTYQMLCDVTGHAEKGMTATLTVK